MDFTKQQKEALTAIDRFLRSDRSVFILRGFAGTGKTTIISPMLELAAAAGKVCQLMAPTGRAAKILSEKTKTQATTIHRAIYELSHIEAVEGDELKESKIEFRFPLRQLDDASKPGPVISPDTSVLIIDEASMVSSRKSSGDLFIFGSGILLDDILRYARLGEGGKVIFVGDPAQLPPVSDPDSFALDDSFFAGRGILVDSYELTDVIRQESDSTILSNSVKLRTLIQSNVRTALVLDRKEGEVEDIPAEEIARQFCRLAPTPSSEGPVVICYSNKGAAAYNNEIRSIYFPTGHDTVQVGDRLIIAGNNYSDSKRDIINGEFATVVSYSKEVEKQVGLVYVDEGEEKKKCIKLELRFRDVDLQFDDGVVIHKKILDSLLDSEQPNITYYEQCALVSNFHIRHSELRVNTPEYVRALMQDPYYNAVRAKYGYAVTCHKAQGGEWDTTFVDFGGRIGLNKDCLRWSYTAATRARKMMYGSALHNIPPFSTKVIEIVKTSHVAAEYYPEGSAIPAGPFHRDSDLASLKARYWQMEGALEGSGFRVVGIEHKPYREIYSIADMEGNTYRCHALYNGAGILRPFTEANPGEIPGELMALVNGGEGQPIPFTYLPSNQNLQDLYAKVTSACDEFGITIVNIVEHLNNYKVIYYLHTDAFFAYLEVCVNKYGQITYIAPRSEIGTEDVKLTRLVESIKQ